MPRKAYLNDLGIASENFNHGNYITNVRRGSDDGEFVFSLNVVCHSCMTDISVLIPDLSTYPENHEYLLFAAEDAPAGVCSALENIPDLRGTSIALLLSLLSELLQPRTVADRQNTLPVGHHDGSMTDNMVNETNDDSDGEEESNEDSQFDGAFDSDPVDDFSDEFPARSSNRARSNIEYASRGRADLRAVKKAGFKIGFLGELEQNNSTYLSVSIRVVKLGISEEAMQAWSIMPEDYIILLIRYESGYKPLDFLLSMDAVQARQYCEMRTGISKSYKALSLDEAQRAFVVKKDDSLASNGFISRGKPSGFRKSFISRPLDQLLNGNLFDILKLCLDRGFSFAESERYIIENQGKEGSSFQVAKGYTKTSEVEDGGLLVVTARGEIRHGQTSNELSFPLLAMQFFLRHFVNAPNFCLICQRELPSELEAIKPYVCDKGLCLYQYMALGFGPAIEHDVLTQPYVVDLLISFCYSSVRSTTLYNFPEGLGLKVPYPDVPINQSDQNYGSNCFKDKDSGGGSRPAKIASSSQEQYTTRYIATLNPKLLTLKVNLSHHPVCPVRAGEWIAIDGVGIGAKWHCRVKDVASYPTLELGEPAAISSNREHVCVWLNVRFQAYRTNFDELNRKQRCATLETLLSLMPSVPDMRDYLSQERGAVLSDWLDKMCPATISLLRWIISSNRSCIMQVDDYLSTDKATEVRMTGEQRVTGLPGSLQFRFAQGAPDKEQRFVNAIESLKGNDNFNDKHPTIFAWHGSRLANWHSIIRESLNFNQQVHGRIYGHGVYFSRHYNTSLVYSESRYPSTSNPLIPESRPWAWQNSILNIDTVMALVELVNAPKLFVSDAPHYVVAQLDWIQTRYLFVQPKGKPKTQDGRKGPVIEQDPRHTPTNSLQSPIDIPITAIPKSRRNFRIAAQGPGASRQSTPNTTLEPTASNLNSVHLAPMAGNDNDVTSTVAVDDDDAASIITDVEDLEILFEDSPQPAASASSSHSNSTKPAPATCEPTSITNAFVPQAIVGLPTMLAPSYATSAATKRLQKEFRVLLNIQDAAIKSAKLDEQGWYLDHEHVSRSNNLYQWIMELHSFPRDLPLAQDLAARNMQSVVFEIRFGPDYPMAPPFIRVIRPRFLPFAHGGGGHVTAGGSICMDLLTTSGWSPAYSMEAVFVQIRAAIMTTERPARLENAKMTHAGMDYGVGEAVEAYKRAARSHGWEIPKGLDQVAK